LKELAQVLVKVPWDKRPPETVGNLEVLEKSLYILENLGNRFLSFGGD
jgi:hypothetical protein